LPYVGTLADGDKVNLKTGQETLKDFANRLKQEHLQAVADGDKAVFQRITIPYKGGQETYYSYCQTHTIHGFGKQRLVINYDRADLADNPVFFISNRLVWQAAGTPAPHLRASQVQVSPAFGATAGPLKSTTRKARPKGWTSINYGTSAPSNAMSR
jgi:hypothetical protein